MSQIWQKLSWTGIPIPGCIVDNYSNVFKAQFSQLHKIKPVMMFYVHPFKTQSCCQSRQQYLRSTCSIVTSRNFETAEQFTCTGSQLRYKFLEISRPHIYYIPEKFCTQTKPLFSSTCVNEQCKHVVQILSFWC